MTCGRRPIQELRIEKARSRFPGAGFEFLAMMKICRWFARRVKCLERRRWSV